MTSEVKVCRNCDREFAIELDDFGFYEKIGITPPTFCPECRRQRRLSWRNDYIFYNRECNLCRRKIISLYSPDKPQIIYCNTCWWSDAWDPKSYGKDFDFSRTFFDQFKELRETVPALALVNDNGIGSENCEYVQNVQYSKNCYMAMVAWKLEDCMYFSYGAEAKQCVDSMGILDASTGLYECIFTSKSFGCRHVRNSSSLIECAYCYDCRGCEHCFMCVNLRNKKYCIKNKQYSKEEYEKIIASYRLDTREGSKRANKEFEELLLTQPQRYATMINCVGCTGNHMNNSKNASNTFFVTKAEDCKYLENGDAEKNSYDLSVGGELEQCYEGLTPDHSQRALFTSYVWKSTDVLYSDFCMSCQDCFGCVGLKHGKYSILNKEYSKEEYKQLKARIIEHMKKTGEWGEFFPAKYSPFAYNESMAQLSFPLSKEEAQRKGFAWQDNIQQTKDKTTIKSFPESIADIQDSITNEILECTSCKRNYKVTLDEIAFYRKWEIPIPENCFYCRLLERFKLRGPSKLISRKCQCGGHHAKNGNYKNTAKHFHDNSHCPNEFKTSYNPERPEIVYCEQCYNSEVA